MKVSVQLGKMPLVNLALTKSIGAVIQACEITTPPSYPKGFEIDTTLCDWLDVKVGSVVAIIDEAACQFGDTSSDNYREVAEDLCEQITAHFVEFDANRHAVIHVTTQHPENKLPESDWDVVGEYKVSIDGAALKSQIADIALDVFHHNTPIKSLDLFAIKIEHNNGTLEPSEFYMSGSLLQLGSM